MPIMGIMINHGELFKELSNYDFWFWDAFNDSLLPSLPLKIK